MTLRSWGSTVLRQGIQSSRPALNSASAVGWSGKKVTRCCTFAACSQLSQRWNIPMVLITHDADLAPLCDRIITMRDGLIVDDRMNLAEAAE